MTSCVIFDKTDDEGDYVPFAFNKRSKTSKGMRWKMLVKRTFPGLRGRRIISCCSRIVQVRYQRRSFVGLIIFIMIRFLLFILVVILFAPVIVFVRTCACACACTIVSSISLRFEKRWDHDDIDDKYTMNSSLQFEACEGEENRSRKKLVLVL